MDLNFIGLEFTALFGALGGLVGIAVVVLTVLVHIVFAIAVYRDATDLDRVRTLIIAGPAIWCIATLHWRRNHSGYLLGDASLTPKSRYPNRLHRNNRNRRSVKIARIPLLPCKTRNYSKTRKQVYTCSIGC